ncbi:MAG: hypothetical protein KDJ38_07850, partial [Gammaproteobacteria bacterium]|nr:hypothetical protein [Gammaproteobacteria bacterium]
MSVDKGMANTAGGVFSLQANLSALLFNLQSGLDDEQRKWVLDAIAQLRQNIDGSELLANRLVSLTSMMKRRLGEQTVRLELPVF